MAANGTSPSQLSPPRPGRKVLGAAVRYGIGIAAGVVALDAVFGRRNELSGAFHTLSHMAWPLAVVAMAVELASIVAYAGVQRQLLASGGVPLGIRPLTRITLAANAIQNSLPAGPAWSTIYVYRQFRRRGVDSALAGWVLLLTVVVAFAALVLLALVGVGMAEGQASSLNLAWAILAAAGVVTILVAMVRRGLLSRPAHSAAVGILRLCQRLVRRPKGEPQALVAGWLQRLRTVNLSKANLAAAAAWALGNWLLDLSCLLIAFLAVHAGVPWRGLLLAYGAGQLAANLPLTLGGLGVVEGSLTVALVFYGGAQNATVAAVLLYRIFSFWVMLPLGWLAALVLRLEARKGPVAP